VVSKDHSLALRPKSPDSCFEYRTSMPSNGDLLGTATAMPKSQPIQDSLV
jgi:hypothetical protein